MHWVRNPSPLPSRHAKQRQGRLIKQASSQVERWYRDYVVMMTKAHRTRESVVALGSRLRIPGPARGRSREVTLVCIVKRTHTCIPCALHWALGISGGEQVEAPSVPRMPSCLSVWLHWQPLAGWQNAEHDPERKHGASKPA